MELLKKAGDLGKRAEDYQKEGNFEFAKKCYIKIIELLTQASSVAESKESRDALAFKVKKYQHLVKEMQQKEANKMKMIPMRSTFSFPVVKSPMSQQPNLIPNRLVVTQNRKPIFNKVKKEKEKVGNIDPDIQNLLVKDINVSFKDIAGMEEVKSVLEEAVIRPRKRPDLYQGIRAPPRGILLYGPPGNGKTYICKALAHESGCTFFALSASSVMNKFVGQSEKMLKKIFHAAAEMSPSIIFIDQIDSILTSRSQNENEASRRLKTEFLVLLDGITSPKSGDILVIGATNLPKQLDLAAKRRFNKLIYVGLPDKESRQEMVLKNLKEVPYDLSKSDLEKIVSKLEGYSASQIKDIVKEACMFPLSELKKSEFEKIETHNVRKVGLKDFTKILEDRKPLLSKEDLAKYKEKS